MHKVIRAIVYASNEEEALARGTNVFETLVQNGAFDYFATFDQDGEGVAGKDRWGDLPVVAEADSGKGKELIEEGMEATREEFDRDMEKIRELIAEFDDDTLFEEGSDLEDGDPKVLAKELKDEDLHDLRMFKHYCLDIGQYTGPSVFLYDDDGEGIKRTSHLENVLNKWGDEEKYGDENIYVVPADVHY